MKKLLPLLSSAVLSVTPMTVLLPQLNSSINESTTWLAPTSMLKLITGLNNYARENSGAGDDFKWITTAQDAAIASYQSFVDKKEGTAATLTKTLVSENTLQSVDNNFTNQSPNDQTIQLPKYSVERVNRSFIKIQLQESFNVNLAVQIACFDTTISGTASTDAAWTDTLSFLKIASAPALEITIPAESVVKLTYNINEVKSDITGVARFEVPLDAEISSAKWSSDTQPETTTKLTFSELVAQLNNAGYGDLISTNNKEFAIISTDNPQNPSKIYFNIPMNWQLIDHRIVSEITQEPINE